MRRSPSKEPQRVLDIGDEIMGHPGTLGQHLAGDVKQPVIPR